jgi:molybdopterin/thiamine biosynthesis adenylyltransferase
MVVSRFARQILAFGEEGQRNIAAESVGIVGLGGIGSHIAQGLAYLGVRDFLLVDDDRVEVTNLNRLVGALLTDAESQVPKVAVGARMIRLINPEASVAEIPKNLRSTEAIEALVSRPVIFGCVDGDGARLILTELAAAYRLTLVDCATEILLEEGRLREFGGRVVVCRPGEFCLDCAQQIDMEIAKKELESVEVREARRRHGYGAGDAAPAPSVVSLNGVIANIAITEFLAMAAGIREPNRQTTYYGLRGNVNVRNDARRPQCYVCGFLVGKQDAANVFRYVEERGQG